MSFYRERLFRLLVAIRHQLLGPAVPSSSRVPQAGTNGDAVRAKLKPMDVRSCSEGLCGSVIFAAPDGRDLAVDIPHEQLAGVRAEFQGYSRGPSLFGLWSAGTLIDCQYTEVIVEVADDRVLFSLVMVSVGLVWQTPADPVDALLLGFHLSLPFFICEGRWSERLPAPIKAQWEVFAARSAWRRRTSLTSAES